MTIVQYKNNKKVLIEFEKTKNRKWVSYSNFIKGNCIDNFYPTVYGIGYLGNTKSCENSVEKHSYKIWRGMIQRCYSSTKNYTQYKDCSVCEEWLCYENFEKWYDDNYTVYGNGIMSLDKDILIKHNKIYSPNTCLIVDSRINTLFIKNDCCRGKYCIGVSYNKRARKYESYLKVGNRYKRKHLGFFNTEREAFNAYKKAKENYIKEIADYYKNAYSNFPKAVYKAMIDYQVEITD